MQHIIIASRWDILKAQPLRNIVRLDMFVLIERILVWVVAACDCAEDADSSSLLNDHLVASWRKPIKWSIPITEII